MGDVARRLVPILGYALGGLPGYIFGTIAGGLLFPPESKKRPTNLADVKLSGPARGAPLPLLYGTQKCRGNMIWAGPLKTIEAGAGGKKGGGGGKGLQSGKGGAGDNTVTYRRSVAYALHEAQFKSQLRKIWAGDDLLYDADDASVQQKSGIDFTYHDGTQTSPDTRIAAYQIGGTGTQAQTISEETTLNGAGPTYTLQKNPLTGYTLITGKDKVWSGTPGLNPILFPIVYFTRVGASPGQNEYTINEATGVLTFGGSYSNVRITVQYQVQTATATQEALVYPHTVYCYLHEFNSGPSPALPNFNFEARHTPAANKIVFWKFNPATAFPQLLSSPDGATWTAQDFATASSGQTNHLGQQLAVLSGKLLAMGDSPLAIYETTDLLNFSKRYGTDLQGGTAFDGRLILRGLTPWAAWSPSTANVSPKVWEDNGAGYTLRFQEDASAQYLYHLADAFGTIWGTWTTILRKWVSGTTWSDIWTSSDTIDRMVYWPAQNRLMLARHKPGQGVGVGEILAFDGTTTPPPAVLAAITDRVGYMVVIGNDLYVLVGVTTNGVTGNTWKLYRCTDLNTATLIAQETLTNTVIPTMALMWHPDTTAFYAAIGTTTLQKIYKAVSPTSGGNPAPTGLLTWTEVYSAAESSSYHIRDGLAYEMGGGADMNPLAIIKDVATHTRYGASLPETVIDATTYDALTTYCQNNDLLISALLENPASALMHIEQVLAHYFGWLGYTGGSLRFGARRVETATREIVHDDALKDAAAVVAMPGPRDTKNMVRVDWLDRDNRYTPAQTYVSDDFDRVKTGVRLEGVALPYCTRGALASRLAAQYFYLRAVPQMGITLTMGPKELVLTPGDVVGFTDAALGLTQHTMRIAAISESEDRGQFRLELYEEPAAVLNLSSFPVQPMMPGDRPPSPIDDPGPTLAQIIELPAELSGGEIRLLFALAGSMDEWAGAAIYLSRDNQTYGRVKQYLGEAAIIGGVVAAVAAIPDRHFLETYEQAVDVDITAAPGDLLGTDRNGMLAGQTLAAIGAEFLSFRTVTLVSGNRYTLKGFLRGWYDSGPTDIAANAGFAPLRSDLPTIVLTSDHIGTTVYFKFPSINQSGVEQSLAGLPVYAMTILGIGRQPDPVYGLQVKEGGVRKGSKTVIGTGQLDVTAGWLYAVQGNAENADLVDGVEVVTKEADFLDYLIRIYSKATAGGSYVLRRTVTSVTTEEHTYTAAQNIADAGTYQPFVKFEVQVRRKNSAVSPVKTLEVEVAP